VARGRHVHAARLFGAAQRIRDQAGSPVPSDEAAGHQADVARLHAENEIDEKLLLSGRTVQGHLLRIFPKLGVHSRRQLRDLDRDS